MKKNMRRGWEVIMYILNGIISVLGLIACGCCIAKKYKLGICLNGVFGILNFLYVAIR